MVDFTFAKWRFALQNGPLRRCFTGLWFSLFLTVHTISNCMVGSIMLTLYFIAVAALFGYMIRKDFFDND